MGVLLMRKTMALILALALWPAAALAQRMPDPSSPAQPTLSTNPACPNAGPSNAAGPGFVGQAYGGVICPAPGVAGNSSATPTYTTSTSPSYTVLPAGSASSGAAQGPVQPGSYLWDTRGTFAGATSTLQALGADGNFATVASQTSPGTACVVLTTPQGSNTPNVKDALSGATGTPSLTSTLTYAPQGCGGGLPTTVNGVTPAWQSSGVAAVTGTFGSAAAVSLTLTPATGRPVDLDILFPAGVSCAINLQRYETTLATWFTTDSFSSSYDGSFSSNETGRAWRLQSTGCTGGSVTYAMEH